jgi:5-deoxy-glucuronate isomerase
MKISAKKLNMGYNSIATFQDLPWGDPKNLKMNFGIVKLGPNSDYLISDPLEKAILILSGGATLRWSSKDEKYSEEMDVSRKSVWAEDPWCLHVPKNITVEIETSKSEIVCAICTTKNEIIFPAKLYSPKECKSEERGKGTMNETSTRIVRTIFDDSNSPEANIVLGEVINYPGKWSSYPPHYHAQPEIYYYQFLPEQGFGFSMLGDNAEIVKNGDAVTIFNETHSQTSAPGYAMYYIWAICHLEGNRYGPKSKTPIFVPEHTWVMKPESQDQMFPKRK